MGKLKFPFAMQAIALYMIMNNELKIKFFWRFLGHVDPPHDKIFAPL